MLLAGLALAAGLLEATLVCWIPPTPWLGIGLQVVCGVVILRGLSGRRAKEFFGLRCRDFGHRWKRGERQVDLEVLE